MPARPYTRRPAPDSTGTLPPVATILSLVHSRSWSESRIDDLLAAAGHHVRTIYPADGDPIPTHLDDIDGVIIGGHLISPYLAHEHRHIADELDLIEQVLSAGLPYLGLCFGAQALATVVGGTIGPRPDDAAELGFYELTPTAAGAHVLRGLTHAFQSHYEACLDVPPGAELLARSDLFEVQAFRIGTSAFGFQFHLDTRADMIPGWWEGNPHLHGRPGTHPLERQLVDAETFDTSIDAWTRSFLDDWIGSNR